LEIYNVNVNKVYGTKYFNIKDII